MHPRHHALLSDSSLLALFGIWRAVLRLGRCPPILAVFIMNLIPKTDGGERTVALFTTCVRTFS
eukprot:114567-Pyramimonas_sp.AAC.1